jgi:hypothetical protein
VEGEERPPHNADNLDVSQSSRAPRPVTGIALPLPLCINL